LCDSASVPEWFDGVLGIESKWKMDFWENVGGLKLSGKSFDQFVQLRLRNGVAMAFHL